ncbi:MAG: hypothetical protein HYU34_02535 [Candidatus Omnitrophica bacterium]|nr:hypothetical protein [Candidatus Omnitrophota bacterium]
MDPAKKESRIRIEAPPQQGPDVPAARPEALPGFYTFLLILAYLFSGASLYLSFVV